MYCLHVLTVGNNATMNIGVQISFQVVFLFPLNPYPEVKLLDHMVVLFLIFFFFWRTSVVFHSGFIFSPKCTKLPFFAYPPQHNFFYQGPNSKYLSLVSHTHFVGTQLCYSCRWWYVNNECVPLFKFYLQKQVTD